MNKIVWILFGLFLVGNSFFVLPFHYSSDSVVTNYYINYKKDSSLLHAVFPDSIIHLKLNMPPLYDALYYKTNTASSSKSKSFVFVNVAVLDNLDFLSLAVPFYKSINLKGQVSFYSTIKIENKPEWDSVALIGNISIYSLISVKGICSPLYVRTLAEKEIVKILEKEMVRVEEDINRPEIADTTAVTEMELIIDPPKKTRGKKKKRN